MTFPLRILTKLITIWALAVSIIGTACGDELQDFFRKLDSAYTRQDAVALVRLAADLEGKDLWSCARGGPTDTVSLRMRVYVVTTDLMFKKGKVADVTAASAEGKFSAPEQKISLLLNLNPQDAKAMLSLFESDDASQRWIGIYKAGFLASPSPRVLEAVKKMALNDDFVIIAEVRASSRDKASSPLLENPRDFVAPLRQMAHEQLVNWKEGVPENPADVAQAGWKRLLREYKVRENGRGEILDAIKIFSESSQAKKSLPTVTAETTDEREAVNAFKKAAKLP